MKIAEHESFKDLFLRRIVDTLSDQFYDYESVENGSESFIYSLRGRVGYYRLKFLDIFDIRGDLVHISNEPVIDPVGQEFKGYRYESKPSYVSKYLFFSENNVRDGKYVVAFYDDESYESYPMLVLPSDRSNAGFTGVGLLEEGENFKNKVMMSGGSCGFGNFGKIWQLINTDSKSEYKVTLERRSYDGISTRKSTVYKDIHAGGIETLECSSKGSPGWPMYRISYRVMGESKR
jgi:hypothetical protein